MSMPSARTRKLSEKGKLVEAELESTSGKHLRLNLRCHVKTLKSRSTKPKILPTYTPYEHPSLQGLNFPRTSIDDILEIITQDVVPSQNFTKAFPDYPIFDDASGVFSWKLPSYGKVTKVQLRDHLKKGELKAMMTTKDVKENTPVDVDEAWKDHAKKNGFEDKTNRIITLDIAFIVLADPNRKRKGGGSEQARKKRKGSSFAIPNTVMINVLSPVFINPEKTSPEVSHTNAIDSFLITDFNERFGHTNLNANGTKKDSEGGNNESLTTHTLEVMRRILGRHIISSDNCMNLYRGIISSKSALYYCAKSTRKKMTLLSRSADLNGYIIGHARDKSNFNSDNSLILNLALGARKSGEDNITIQQYFSNESITESDKLLSDNEYEDPIEFQTKRKIAREAKDETVCREYFLLLYSKDDSPMHFGFTQEMMNVMVQSSCVDENIMNYVILQNIFPPPQNFCDRMKSILGNRRDDNLFEGLSIEKDKFPPRQNSRAVPTLAEWKRSEKGRNHSYSNGESKQDVVRAPPVNNYLAKKTNKGNVDSTIAVGSAHSHDEGVIEVHIGENTTSIIFGPYMEITSNSIFYEALRTVKGHPVCNKGTQQREFKVMCCDGQYARFTKEQATRIPISNVYSTARIPAQRCHLHVFSEVRSKVNIDDFDGELSE